MTAYKRIFVLVFLVCATLVVGVSVYAGHPGFKRSVHIGVFNSKTNAQQFFESLPPYVKDPIELSQLWLDVYESPKGFSIHNINITDIPQDEARALCDHVTSQHIQCVISGSEPLFINQKQPQFSSSNIAFKGLRADTNVGLAPLNLDYNPTKERAKYNVAETTTLDLLSYANQFSLTETATDTPQQKAAKAAYKQTKSQLLTAIQNIGAGINQGNTSAAAKQNLMALTQNAFNAAGEAYLQDIFGRRKAGDNDLPNRTVIEVLKQGLVQSTEQTAKEFVADLLAGGAFEEDNVTQKIDGLLVSGAKSAINAGILAARNSDLYVLRNLELEYNLNNFERASFRFMGIQPIYQTADVRHSIFLQGGGIINEKSVDVDDDVSRHTANIGAAYRYLTEDEKYLLGANIFYDHQWPYNHSRMSLGIDAKAENLNLAANYYRPLSGYKDSRRDDQGNLYEERALEGYDVELGYEVPQFPDLNLFGKGYQYFRETDEDIRGLELSAEYNIRDDFTLKGSLVEENGGRDGVEVALQYRIPLYDPKEPNLVLADIEPAAGKSSMRSKVFEKVRRENRIRVEERLKDDQEENISAQFSAASIGLPFDVGGTFTLSGVNLPLNTAITIPTGSFGIINFSNGAIANLSASGAGNVIVEFNATTLTVTQTGGGFVQFISASGGISVVNVPGGTVNLLGTDIDITDDGATTTIHVRAGAIETVPDVGVDVENGDQGEVVSLTVASGVTSLLTDPALTTRKENAFTNLDLMNPDPPITVTSAPFIAAQPSLITGPQFVGNNADIQFTFTQPVTVSGIPQLTALVGANTRIFDYNATASTPLKPVFRYTFIAGDVGAGTITPQIISLSGGAIKGSANNLDALLTFTSGAISVNDQTAPSLTSSTPVDDEPLFVGSANIILNFNENIQASAGDIILTDTTDGSDNRNIPIGDAQVSIVGSVLTLNPTTNLELATDYDLTIASGVIEDTTGNDFAGIASGELNFTTANDLTPPSLTGSTPADDATGIAQNTNIVLNFNEDIQAIAGNIVLTDTTDGSDNRSIPIGDAQVSISGSMLTINPTTDLEIGTAYDVTMATGVIEDLFGNDFTGITTGTVNFTTTAITSLSQVTGLAAGNYIVTGNGQTFTGYVYNALGSSWLLVGKGREGWEFDSNGQGTNAGVATNLGVVAGFSPNAYEDAIINDLITNAAIDLTGVEILIHRAADTTGTNYQDVLWRPTVQTAWIWSFDDPSPGYTVIHDVQASILGAASSSTRTTRDANAGNDWRRIFTWPWGSHASQQGFSYGSSISGVNGNDPNTFLWENGSENHAIPYAEIYIRVE